MSRQVPKGGSRGEGAEEETAVGGALAVAGFREHLLRKVTFSFSKSTLFENSCGRSLYKLHTFQVCSLKGTCTSYCTCYFQRRLCKSRPTRPAAVLAQRGGFTGYRLCRRPFQNSMFGCLYGKGTLSDVVCLIQGSCILYLI